MEMKELIAIVIAGVVFLIVYNQFRILVRMKRLVGRRVVGAGGENRSAASLDDCMLYFYSPTCGSCRTMNPVIDDLFVNYRDIVMVDVSKSRDLAERFEIMAIPTTIFIKDGVIRRVYVGIKKEATLAADLRYYFNNLK